METRAHHLLIGTFMLAMSVGLILFFLWLAKMNVDETYTDYEIYFEESVAGLSRGSDVRYNGIPVGEVQNITIVPNEPSKVLVIARILAEVPIKTDSVAVIAMQGVTGVGFVLIEGGSVNSPLLEAKEDGKRLVIPSRISPFSELFEGAPDLLNQSAEVVAQLKQLLSDDNIANLAAILANGKQMTADVAAQTKRLEELTNSALATLDEASKAATAVSALMAKTDQLVEGEVTEALAKLNSSLGKIDGVMDGLNDFVAAGEAAATTVNATTLPEVGRLITDLRRTAKSLANLTEKIEADPAQFILSNKRPRFGEKQ